MSKYTKKELEMINVFVNASVAECGCFSENHNQSYCNADDLMKALGWSSQQVGGVMSSLLKKEAVHDTQETYGLSDLSEYILIDFDFEV